MELGINFPIHRISKWPIDDVIVSIIFIYELMCVRFFHMTFSLVWDLYKYVHFRNVYVLYIDSHPFNLMSSNPKLFQ